MPNINSIVLVDDASANVTFTPNNKSSDGTFHLLDQSAGQANLASHLSIFALAKMNGVSRGKVKLEVTKITTDADTGNAFPDGKAIAEIEVKYPQNFTSGDRAKCFAMLKSAFDDAIIAATLRDTEGSY